MGPLRGVIPSAINGARGLLASALLLIAAAAYAQVGRVAGQITDDAGRPIRGATITAQNKDLTPSSITGSTDGRGRFSMLGLRRGVWMFTIQAPGFETAYTRLDVVTIRPNPPLNVKLAKGLNPVPPGALAQVDAADLQTRLDAAAALASTGDLNGAIGAYRAVLERVPALTTLHLQIGALLERKPDPAAALAEYEALAKKEPENPRARAAIDRLSRR